jgi:hypothetical protein
VVIQHVEDKMGGACGTYRGTRIACMFWWEYLKEKDHLEYTDVDGMIILNYSLKQKCMAFARFMCLRNEPSGWQFGTLS